jgi:hypothetical protein
VDFHRDSWERVGVYLLYALSAVNGRNAVSRTRPSAGIWQAAERQQDFMHQQVKNERPGLL